MNLKIGDKVKITTPLSSFANKIVKVESIRGDGVLVFNQMWFGFFEVEKVSRFRKVTRK